MIATNRNFYKHDVAFKKIYNSFSNVFPGGYVSVKDIFSETDGKVIAIVWKYYEYMNFGGIIEI